MKIFASISKICTAVAVTALVAVGTAGAASAATANFTVFNNFGSTIFLDSSSCSPSGFVSGSFSIANGGSGTLVGSSTDSGTLCTIRFQSANGTYGCQFVVDVFNGGGFVSGNAYKGSGGRPVCNSTDGGGGVGTHSGSFTMQ